MRAGGDPTNPVRPQGSPPAGPGDVQVDDPTREEGTPPTAARPADVYTPPAGDPPLTGFDRFLLRLFGLTGRQSPPARPRAAPNIPPIETATDTRTNAVTSPGKKAYEGFTMMRSEGGAILSYKMDETTGEVIVAGRLYDVASLVNIVFGGWEGFSLSAIVGAIRGDRNQPAGEFESNLVSVHPRYNSETGMYEVTLQSLNPLDSMAARFDHAADMFEAKSEIEIEESVTRSGYWNSDQVWEAFESVFQNVSTQQARRVRAMLSSESFEFPSKPCINAIDVGLRLSPEGDVKAVVLRFVEGGLYSRRRFGNRFQGNRIFRNISTWVGRFTDYGIAWEISDTHHHEEANGVRAEQEIAKHLFKGGISHTYVFVKDQAQLGYAQTIESAGGALINVRPLNDHAITISGDVYDVASFARSVMNSDEVRDAMGAGWPRNDWSVGSVVRQIKALAEFRRAELVIIPENGSRTGTFEVALFRERPVHRGTADKPASIVETGDQPPPISPEQYRKLVGQFRAQQERILEEGVTSDKLSAVVLTLEGILRNIATPQAERFSGMFNTLLDDNRITIERPDGNISYWTDVGVRQNRAGQVTAFVIRFMEGSFGEDGAAKLQHENESTFVGTPSADGTSISWEVSNTDSQVSGATSFERHRDVLSTIFANVAHTYSDAPAHGTAESASRRSAAHYLGRERSVRRRATARLGARHVFTRAALGRARIARTVMR